jgi:hypothetical protein
VNEIDDGTVAMDSVEALVWLLAVLAEGAASLLVLAALCRRAKL